MALKEVESEITGKVWKIEAKPGEAIEVDETIMILESMKMEIPVDAPVSGTLKEILVEEDEAVKEGQILAVIEL